MTARKKKPRPKKQPPLTKATAKRTRKQNGQGAPKGNQFWKLRSKHGREKTFATAETLWDSCVEYFEAVEANPLPEEKIFQHQGTIIRTTVGKMRAMTIGGLCTFLDITIETWGKYREHKDYSEVVTRVEQIIREQKFAGAAAEMLNPSIIARDLGLAERQDVVTETQAQRLRRLAAMEGANVSGA